MSRLCLFLLAVALVQPPPLYRFTISIADARGRAVTDLTPAEIAVSIGGAERAATVLEADPRPLSIVVIADGADSTESLNVRAALKEVVRRLRGGPGSEDVRVALMLGEQGARVPVLEPAQAAVADHDRRIARFFFAPDTAPPADTLSAAADALSKEEGRRRAILIMSVNRRDPSTQSFAHVVSGVRRADVTLAAIETGSGRDQSLWMIQSAVGGRYERVGDVAAFSSVAPRLAGALMSAYQVSFPSAEPATAALKVKIKGRDRLTIIAPSWVLR
jgi:hypothetical protein